MISWNDLELPPINLWTTPMIYATTNYPDPLNPDSWANGQIEAMIQNDSAYQIKARSSPSEGSSIDATLAERETRYGSFTGHAMITQNIKRAMYDSAKWHELDDDMRESLEMVAHKIGRILNGDPYYKDSWRDLVGYATLISNRLED